MKSVDRHSISIHSTADVASDVVLGTGSRVWHEAQIREGARLGENCVVGKGVYIDFGVQIGRAVKIQNRASIYHGTTIEDGVFIGPHVVFTNDLRPRAINAEGELKSDDDWDVGETTVQYGASIGAGSIILPGLEIGRFALIGAGSVVTKNVPDFGIIVGNPARLVGHACMCAARLDVRGSNAACPSCGCKYKITSETNGNRYVKLLES